MYLKAQPTVPNPTEGHGWTVENGVMQPLWTDNDVLPKEIVDILEETRKLKMQQTLTMTKLKKDF